MQPKVIFAGCSIWALATLGCSSEAAYTIFRGRPVGEGEFQALQSASSKCPDGSESENCKTANQIAMQRELSQLPAASPRTRRYPGA